MILPSPFPMALFTLPAQVLPLAKMLASQSQFALVVKGGIVGLVAATATILLIWLHEMRRGRIW